MNLLSLKNSNRIVLVTSFLLFAFAFSVSPVRAQPKQNNKKDLEQKKKKIKDEINNINDLLHETRKDKKQSLGAVLMLNKKISAREELIATISSEIRVINNQVGENQKQIDDLKRNLEKLKKEYAKMIYFAYRNKDSYNKLMFLFAAGDFNQAYQRLKYFQQYNEYRKTQAVAITKTQVEIADKINELEEKKRDKKQLLSSEEQEKMNLGKEKAEQEDVLVKLQDKEKQLKDELEQKKRDAENLTAAIKKLIQEEIRRQEEEEKKKLIALNKKKEEKKKKKATNTTSNKTEEPVFVPELTKEAEQLSSDFAANKGRLPWPVVKGVITENFGEHEHPTIKGFIENNTSVGITTSKGSSARAVFGGEVTGVASVPGAGKIIIIRHGEYLSVYSNLSEVLVKTGDKISIKQNIGNISYNDDDDKTTVNLQIWKGQKILNPEDWLYK
ncbi:MAG: murein hydrolase activator EnvC family protein [Bacteroidia bacterium]